MSGDSSISWIKEYGIVKDRLRNLLSYICTCTNCIIRKYTKPAYSSLHPCSVHSNMCLIVQNSPSMEVVLVARGVPSGTRGGCGRVLKKIRRQIRYVKKNTCSYYGMKIRSSNLSSYTCIKVLLPALVCIHNYNVYTGN